MMILRSVWAAFAAGVPLVLVANLSVLAAPHVRGIGFVPELRYAVMTIACMVGALLATLLDAWAKGHADPSPWTLPALLAGCALVVLALMRVVGRPGLVSVAAPAVVAIGVTLALLVPRFLERPPRVLGGMVTVLFGLLEGAGVALALASERPQPPGPNGMAFDVPRAVFDVRHAFVDLPSGAHVHYVDEGTGPTLLFLHGNPAWSFQWRDLVTGLRSAFRCVALDYPGFGLSTAPDGYGFTPREQSRVVEEFVDHLGLRDVTLVMQDWGGPIGLGWAGRRPELVRRVILGNTWAWPTTVSEARGKFSVIVGGPIGEFAQMNFNAFASFGLSHGIIRKLPEDVFDVYLRPFLPLNRRGVAAFYPGQITVASDYMREVEAGLPRVGDRPALIFWGMRDRGFPKVDLERFEKVFLNHKTIQLPDADHFFFEDAKDLMIAEIKNFAEAHPPAGS
jgi:pimeloyl-ACP methyl ester carboxylesterase